MTAPSNPEVEIIIFLVMTALIGAGLFFAYDAAMKRSRHLFWQRMREINAQHGTAFPTDPSQMHLVLGSGVGQALLFDETNRKIFLLTNPAQGKGEVLDYSYIRQWGFKAKSRFIGNKEVYHDIHIEFGTSDVKRPVIRIPTGSHANANQWMSRLPILLKL